MAATRHRSVRWNSILHSIVIAAALLGLAPTASAVVATFEGLTEGFYNSFTSGGITFTNGLWFPDLPPAGFAIDDASGDFDQLGFGDIWSPTNVMTVGGFVTGPESGFFRVHAWDAAAGGQVFTHGSVDVFHVDDFIGATATLQAFMNDQLVDSDSFTIVNSNPGTAVHHHLSVDGAAFNRLRFVVSGGPPGGDENGILAVFDNVVMAPAPGSLAMLALALAGRRRPRA